MKFNSAKVKLTVEQNFSSSTENPKSHLRLEHVRIRFRSSSQCSYCHSPQKDQAVCVYSDQLECSPDNEKRD